jgi:hypothetical protein
MIGDIWCELKLDVASYPWEYLWTRSREDGIRTASRIGTMRVFCNDVFPLGVGLCPFVCSQGISPE